MQCDAGFPATQVHSSVFFSSFCSNSFGTRVSRAVCQQKKAGGRGGDNLGVRHPMVKFETLRSRALEKLHGQNKMAVGIMHMINRAVTLLRRGHYDVATAHHILGAESACGAPSREITEKCKEPF